ncbi:hypothetical protein PUNSTDRAFT_103627 [Punctularia strigosozonata HHB-11173 SS5]|uniref:uncharacterized protein n=1 Tax=Punctularia strigosozonata (strain HHB-11173) TaxID=741275 RepID=UPI000441790B|nr:uncharacterized protein PUNSTDRAFT_103627 [Punctularia strigosozonata HHB-11173 SS5]EIN07594.1 hypothetical protein PUNSTDRAFT_103627 [Punctularia strigosozonata HHB-11173 SS5]
MSTRPPKTIVLCFDGTSNEYDGTNTDVVKFFGLLNKDLPDEQVCYYQAGIGTYFAPGVVSPVWQWCAKILDEAFAWYLYAHVTDGYKFLMQNYSDGDRICLFGFSRGAYTARALAGMLHKIGLLPKDNLEQLSFAYKIYTKTDQASMDLAAGFKRTFCRNVQVNFVGVWETVASVGVLWNKNLPFTTANTTVKTFRQALALDEHRVKFLPSLYPRPSPNPSGDPHQASFRLEDAPQDKVKVSARKQKQKHEEPAESSEKPAAAHRWRSFWNRKAAMTDEERGLKPCIREINPAMDASASAPSSAGSDTGADPDPGNGDETDPAADQPANVTDVLQVWFSGCHSDVGGGSVPDTADHSLANITLRWMVRQVLLAQCGVLFDSAALDFLDISDAVFPPVSSSKASEKELQQDEADALAPNGVHDELKAIPAWWLLEIIPLPIRYQDKEGVWKKKWTFHLGRGRVINDPAPNFHVTVKARVQDTSLKYTPRARWAKGTEVYVE